MATARRSTVGMDRRRLLPLAALLALVAAAFVAVSSGLGTQPPVVAQAKAAAATITYHTVIFGHSSVGVQKRPGGLTCFAVNKGASTVARSCAAAIYADQIEYASSRFAVGGLAGADVRAVIVKLTKRGTVWATMRSGAFYAAVPAGHNVRAVVKVLSNGSRTSFTVTGQR